MKKIILPALAVLVLAVTFNSCSMEKRHYMKGYYMSKNNNKEVTAKPSVKQVAAIENAAIVEVKQESAPVATTSNEAVAVQPVIMNENNTPVVLNKAVVENVKSSTPVTTVKSDKKSDRPTISKGKAAQKAKNHGSQMPEKGLLILLAIFIPWLAVGLATDWEIKPLLINLLLSLTCIGAIIHAIVIVNRNA
jgi:uncharacterized membrane protein YqaE (UPF0057 family)